MVINLRLRKRPAAPITPVASNRKVEGSGVAWGLTQGALGVPMETLLVSSVTAPFCANALPHLMLAPVVRVMQPKNKASLCVTTLIAGLFCK